MNQTKNHSRNNIVYHLKNVVKKREKGGNRFELHIPDFTIHVGEFVAIVGESGCGKSTMLDMLSLILSPTDSDEFLIRISKTGTEHQVAGLSEEKRAEIRKAHFGYVLQTGGLLPFLTVHENVLLPCTLNEMTGMEEHVDSILKSLKIKEHTAKKPQYLSGGQRQRVAIARALSHRPSIVLADEPTAAVDKLTAIEIRDQFKELTQELGVALLMVTHDEHLVQDVADRTFTFDVRKKSEEYTHSTCRERA